MSDIDVYQQNLRPFRSLENLVEISFKKCVFLHFVNNKCIILFFWEKTITIRKMRIFYKWA